MTRTEQRKTRMWSRALTVAVGAAIVIAGVVVIGFVPSNTQPVRADRTSEEFEKLYQQWREFRATPKGGITRPFIAPPQREMRRLGPQVIDDIIAKLPEDPELAGAIHWLTGSGPTVEELQTLRTREDKAKWYLKWWEEGQAGENRRFEENYARGDLEAIRRQGIAALPKIMEKLKAGDTDLLPVVRRILKVDAQRPRHSELLPLMERLPEEEGEMSPAEAREAAAFCLKWWEEHKHKWLIPFPDQHTE